MPLAALCALTEEMGRSPARASCLTLLPKLSVVGSCAEMRAAKELGRDGELGCEREPAREWRGGVRV